MRLIDSGERTRGALMRRRRQGYAKIRLCFGCGARCGKGVTIWFGEAICADCMARGDEHLAHLAMRLVSEKEL